MGKTRRHGAWVVSANLFIAIAVGGCDCKSDTFTEVAPKIIAIPNPIVFDDVPAQEPSLVTLLIKNDGNADLTLDGEPTLTENSEDAFPELTIRAIGVPVNCTTGDERADDTPKTLGPGQCVSIDVVYFPQNIGADTGSIVIESDDPKTPVLTVPINATGSAPDIEVCLLAGPCVAAPLCNDAGPLTLDFGLQQMNTTTTCEVQITNKGALDLKALYWEFKTGNRRRDYSLSPAELGSLGDLAPGEGVTVTVDFNPRSGGPKDALLEITSSDPDERAVEIILQGMGDGPKVCPDPFPSVDFGQVVVGTTLSQDVTLTNCGTLALEITALEIQDGAGAVPSGEFALGAGAPGVPIALAPAADAVVPVEFTPRTQGLFTGRLYLESTDPVVPSGWVTIVGEGVVPPACALQASTTSLNFGTAAPSSAGGQPIEKTLALSNPGQVACTGVDAVITAGAAVSFSIVGFPPGTIPYTLNPGDIVVFTLQYDPADVTGPDTGTLRFTATELTGPVDVTLNGTPVAQPQCDLKVTPTKGNFQFSECTLFAGFTPRVAQFGATKIGTDKTLPITVENVGSVSCTISEVSLHTFSLSNPFGGPDPSWSIESPANQLLVAGVPTSTLQPGEVGEALVKYTPISEEQNCASVWIQTSNVAYPNECTEFGIPPLTGTDGCYMVSMTGQGVRSEIEVIPSTVDFGVITVGCASQDRDVDIYNIGQDTLSITAVYVDPPGSPFTLTSVPPLPFVLSGGGNLSIRIKYQPPDANAHNALLIIESDATNSPFFTVPLKGSGTLDTHQTDTFQQLSEPLVDVLWIIDDSCSMSAEQNNIATNGNTFLARALSLSTDFQIGVVTTDMKDASKSGLLQSGGPTGPAAKIIDRSNPDPVGDFQKSIRQGTFGSGNERGLEAAHRALSSPLIDDPAFNQGFLRADAKLVMIVVSDEEDSSTPPVDFYVDFFKNIKGYRNSDLMSFNAIVGEEPSGCSSSDGSAGAGTRYLEVARRTGGLERSICSNDWGQIADDLGLDAFGSKSQFFLSREPIPATIEVRVNGVLKPAGNWSYEASSNSIIFDPTQTPPQSSTVVVDYDTICR